MKQFLKVRFVIVLKKILNGMKKDTTSKRKRREQMIKYCPDLTGFEIKEGGDK